MRFEFKYYVPNFRLPELQAMIRPFLLADKFAAGRPGSEYTVRSIYFESPGFEMYRSKVDHLAHRLKVRLRGYNIGDDSSQVFLEIKRKYEGPILKNRAILPFGSVKKIFAGQSIDQFLPETKRADDVRRFFYQVHAKQLRPLVNVVYEREAYVSGILDPENDLRITLDKNLRAVPRPKTEELFVERNLAWPLDGHFILEVKFNNYCPAWIKPILASMDLQKQPASKYVLSVDAHRLVKG